jgi:hypothetical protein
VQTELANFWIGASRRSHHEEISSGKSANVY